MQGKDGDAIDPQTSLHEVTNLSAAEGSALQVEGEKAASPHVESNEFENSIKDFRVAAQVVLIISAVIISLLVAVSQASKAAGWQASFATLTMASTIEESGWHAESVPLKNAPVKMKPPVNKDYSKPAPSPLPACAARQLERVRPGNLSGLVGTPRESVLRPAAFIVILGPRSYRPEQKHWEYVADFVSIPGSEDYDTYIIFTTNSSLYEFQDFSFARARAAERPRPRYSALDFSLWMSESSALDLGQGPKYLGGIVAAKVYFALSILFVCYDYLLRSDAEVRMLRPDLVVPHVQAFMANGLVLANSGNAEKIVASPQLTADAVNFFNESDRMIWRKATLDHQLSFWFNSLPIYDCRDLPDFLKLIRIGEAPPFFQPSKFLNWEFNVYTAYKVIRGDWRFIDINHALTLKTPFRMEDLLDFVLYKRIAEAYPPGPLWVRSSACGTDNCACAMLPDEQQPLMFFHLNYPSYEKNCPEAMSVKINY